MKRTEPNAERCRYIIFCTTASRSRPTRFGFLLWFHSCSLYSSRPSSCATSHPKPIKRGRVIFGTKLIRIRYLGAPRMVHEILTGPGVFHSNRFIFPVRYCRPIPILSSDETLVKVEVPSTCTRHNLADLSFRYATLRTLDYMKS